MCNVRLSHGLSSAGVGAVAGGRLAELDFTSVLTDDAEAATHGANTVLAGFLMHAVLGADLHASEVLRRAA